MQKETRKCQNCQKDFTIEPEDFTYYEKIKVPAPTFCFRCRLQRKMVRRNERTLYRRKCDLCGLTIISMYPEQTPFPVYCPKCWWSDGWDPKNFGSAYDFNKPFFKQWHELSMRVPRASLYQKNNVNSPYSNHSEGLKNSYMALNCGLAENVFNSKWIVHAKDLADCYNAPYCELSYEIIESKRCSRSSYLEFCKNCIDCSYLYNCYDCMNCFLSSNLRNKKYIFKNRQLSKEDYEKAVSEFTGSYSGHRNAWDIYNKEILPATPRRFMNSGRWVNSTGDYIFTNTKNSKMCFRVASLEDCAYCVDSIDLKDSYDAYESALPGCEQQYECHAGNHLAFSRFTSISYDSHDLEYCEMCHDSEYLFGCVAMRKKKYCILNKQYSKEEYEGLVQKIKEQMDEMPYKDNRGKEYRYGEYFPTEISPFCYNESIAQEFFPLDKETAEKDGYRWKDREKRNYQIEIKPEDLPDNTQDTNDELAGKTIECAHYQASDHASLGCDEACTEAFKIMPDELALYKRMNFPLPRMCANCRQYARQGRMNPMKLWPRQCMCEKTDHDHKGKCPNKFETSYAPDRPEIVYCESCYHKEVY